MILQLIAYQIFCCIIIHIIPDFDQCKTMIAIHQVDASALQSLVCPGDLPVNFIAANVEPFLLNGGNVPSVSLVLCDLPDALSFSVVLIVRRFRSTTVVSFLTNRTDHFFFEVPADLLQVWHRSHEPMLLMMCILIE